MQETTPVTRSRLPFVAIGVWAAILAAIVAIGLVFGGRALTNASQSPLGAGGPGLNGISLTAPLAADPSAAPGASTAPGASRVPGTQGDGAPKGPGGFAFRGGQGGPGGPDGHGGPGRGPGRGPVSITAINGSQLSLKTDDGWTRTIDATGATVTEQDGTAITIGALKVGDQIAFRQTRNTDGTYKITAIVRIAPQAGGTVKSVDATSIVVTLPDGTTKTIGITGTTTYSLKGKAATAADVKVGSRVHATGTVDGSGNFTATKVDIAPAEVGGTVTSKTASTITIKDQSGATVTVNVTGTTTYRTRGNNAATLADVAVGNVLHAEGTLNGDGSLTATAVDFGAAGKIRPNGFGGRGPHGSGAKPGNGNGGGAAPSPSANAG